MAKTKAPILADEIERLLGGGLTIYTTDRDTLMVACTKCWWSEPTHLDRGERLSAVEKHATALALADAHRCAS